MTLAVSFYKFKLYYVDLKQKLNQLRINLLYRCLFNSPLFSWTQCSVGVRWLNWYCRWCGCRQVVVSAMRKWCGEHKEQGHGQNCFCPFRNWGQWGKGAHVTLVLAYIELLSQDDVFRMHEHQRTKKKNRIVPQSSGTTWPIWEWWMRSGGQNSRTALCLDLSAMWYHEAFCRSALYAASQTVPQDLPLSQQLCLAVNTGQPRSANTLIQWAWKWPQTSNWNSISN